ncbi:hypothetical protein ACIPJG_18110 [Streptomyces halstedii]
MAGRAEGSETYVSVGHVEGPLDEAGGRSGDVLDPGPVWATRR